MGGFTALIVTECLLTCVANGVLTALAVGNNVWVAIVVSGMGAVPRLGVSVCALLFVGDRVIAAPDMHPNAQADKIKLRITTM
jgi:hypothetical protein